MANPRKFSEKIALHNQKQAEETAAFEQIMKEVMGATRDIRPPTPSSPLNEYLDPRLHVVHGAYQKHHLHINQSLGAYRGGSLPNVNQIANNSIDLQSALTNLEDMKQGRENFADRHLRERGRHAVPHRNRHFLLEKRIDVSPYGSTSYLSPPLDTSWRRTNSDSALHQSAMAAGSPQDSIFLSANSPPTQRKGLSVMQQQGLSDDLLTDHTTMLLMDTGQHVKEYWDPKKAQEEANALLINSRPKSCDAPTLNMLTQLRMYPLQQEDTGVGSVIGSTNSLLHLGINNNTGSLPDLSNLHFPPPLATPIDSEGDPLSSSPSYQHGIRGDTLSPPNTHIIGQSGGITQNSSSVGPGSPRHLNHHHMNHQHLKHQTQQQHHHQQQLHQAQQVRGLLRTRLYSTPTTEPPRITVEGLAVDTNALSLDPYPPNQVYGVYSQQQQPQSPTRHQNFGPPSPTLPQVPAGSYRSTTPSDHSCSAPTSPVSHSLSPISSPGLGPSSQLSKSPFTDSVYSPYLQNQQHSPQQTTSALQHQLEQFKMVAEADQEAILNMIPDVSPVCTTSSSPTTPPSPGVFLTGLGDLGGGYGPPPPLRDIVSSTGSSLVGLNGRGSRGIPPALINCSVGQENSMDSVYYSIAYSTVPDALVQSPTFYSKTGGIISSHQNTPQTPQTPTSIPDIILTAPDAIRQDFAKDLGSAMASMSGSFDSDFFPSAEELRVGLEPIDFEGLHMLADSDLTAGIAESVGDDAFSLDRS